MSMTAVNDEPTTLDEAISLIRQLRTDNVLLRSRTESHKLGRRFATEANEAAQRYVQILEGLWNPLTDQTPIDEAWLRSIGASEDGSQCYLQLPHRPTTIEFLLDDEAPGRIGYCCIENSDGGQEIKTRGQVRALCLSLGYGFDESKKQETGDKLTPKPTAIQTCVWCGCTREEGLERPECPAPDGDGHLYPLHNWKNPA